jgi:hypothetical protein
MEKKIQLPRNETWILTIDASLLIQALIKKH